MAIFSIFFNIKVCCVFSLESPRRVHEIHHFQYQKENHHGEYQICSYGVLFQGTQERVRNSRGKRAISVRVTELLLYLCP